MDWFEKLTGFRETEYEDTRAKLVVEGRRLRSLVNGESYAIGKLEAASLEALRQRVNSAGSLPGRLRTQVVTGDVRRMHRLRENAGALFQVASQFNFLEMVSPSVTPDQGVTRYESDQTQGPACAIAAGAATIYRNYFAPAAGGYGQTAKRQINALAPMGEALSGALEMPIDALWTMQNGYALCQRRGLAAINRYLATLDSHQFDSLRGKLCVGLHWDVEATETAEGDRPLVSQAFCSALPIAYSGVASAHWERFACLVLEAAYEATMWAGVLNAQRGASNVVLLTLLGGGAFGNPEAWIRAAIRRALRIAAGFELYVKIVTYGAPSTSILELAEEFR